MLYPTGIKAGMQASGQAAPSAGLPHALAGLPIGALLSAAVVGRDGAGQLMLRTAAGMALINTTLKLARGTLVNLRVRAGAAPYLSLDSVVGNPRPGGAAQPVMGLGLAAELNETLASLRKLDPGLADRAVQRAVAAPGDRMASTLLFFLAALKSGDFTGWFGAEAVQALKSRARADLAARLAETFGQQMRFAEQPAADEWQALFIPLQDGEAVRQLRLFYRRYRQGGGDDPDHDTRFIVEIESSRLGGMQLDGLVRAERFDLVLRSHRPLPDEALLDISEIYADGLAITGQKGKIAFQTMERFPISPLDHMLGQENQGFLV